MLDFPLVASPRVEGFTSSILSGLMSFANTIIGFLPAPFSNIATFCFGFIDEFIILIGLKEDDRPVEGETHGFHFDNSKSIDELEKCENINGIFTHPEFWSPDGKICPYTPSKKPAVKPSTPSQPVYNLLDWMKPGAAAHDVMALKYKPQLTKEQFHVAYEAGTEPPFKNAFYDNKADGIYVSVASGVPLFSSKDKYDSGTGWPSFTKPLESAPIVEIVDKSRGMSRMEVRVVKDHVHLGHVFKDGPKSKGGKRYCMNSTSMKFIPKDKLTASQ